eukprot:TRINITY_DN29623_c0_g1_i1.p2 TRINITY_DN29623_c0_g1~~TRINITY_DN29623_c0_g1_i1.p2  ORF type:complete len:163 (+),score=24.68 TRINITY_DN29623_c0_g1_i1:59-490(+)
MVYWDVKPFYGFGVGAASYIHGRRFARPKKLNQYNQYVKQLAENSPEGGMVAGEEVGEISTEDFMLDWVMLRCRLKDGINLTRFEEMFGSEMSCKLVDCVKQVDDKDLVEIDEDKKFIRLTDPHGWLLSNNIISNIFAGLSQH